MKRKLKLVFSLFLAFSFIFATPSIAFAAEKEQSIEVELVTKELHNDIFSSSVDLSDYIPDLTAFKNDVLQQYMLDKSNLTDPEGYGYLDLSKYKLPAETLLYKAVCEFIWYESPELFRATGFVADLGGKNEDMIIGLKCSYIYENPQDFVNAYNASVENADKLLKGIEGNTTLSDLEKALLLHDRLALFCEYDVENLENDTLVEKDFNIYGALGEGVAVCMGYALAYDYLLERVGIESQYCSSEKMEHAWNVVYINNKPYHVDVTWDDTATIHDVSGQVFHDNFLRSTNGIKETGHKYGVFNRTDYITTPTDTTYDNYFWQDSITAFQLLDDKLYYIDSDFTSEDEAGKKGKLIELDDINDSTPTVLKTITDGWKNVEEGGLWKYNFSRLAAGSGMLYYSTNNSVISVNPQTKEELIIVSPEKFSELTGGNGNYGVYGLGFKDCSLGVEYSTTPNFTAKTKKEKTYSIAIHQKGEEWRLVTSPSEEKPGKECITCVYCDYVFEEKQLASLGNKHNWGEWYYSDGNAPTCEEGAIRIKTCLDDGCTAYKWEKVGATGHKASEWKIKYSATQERNGYKYKECTACKKMLDGKRLKYVSTLAVPRVSAENTSGGIKVSWNEVENAESYTLYRRVYNESTKKYSAWTVLKTNYMSTNYIDKNVKFGVIYSYTVRAVSGSVRSSYKAATGVRYNVTPIVTLSNVSNGVKVTWTKVENASGYTVYSASYNAKTKKWSGWTNRGTVSASKTSWTDTKVKSGVYYKYTVRACKGSFKGSYKASEKICYLSQPTVTVKAASSGVNVTWTQCTGEKCYTIYRAEYNTATKKWSGWKNMGTVEKDKTSWTDKSAKKGVYYKYTVRVVNGDYKSAFKESASVKR